MKSFQEHWFLKPEVLQMLQMLQQRLIAIFTLSKPLLTNQSIQKDFFCICQFKHTVCQSNQAAYIYLVLHFVLIPDCETAPNSFKLGIIKGFSWRASTKGKKLLPRIKKIFINQFLLKHKEKLVQIAAFFVYLQQSQLAPGSPAPKLLHKQKLCLKSSQLKIMKRQNREKAEAAPRRTLCA